MIMIGMNADVTIEAGIVHKGACEAREETCESNEPHEVGEEPCTNAERFLQDVFHVSPVEKPTGVRGILHTRD